MGEKWEELQNALANKICILMWGFETSERKALVIGWMKSESIDTLLQAALLDPPKTSHRASYSEMEGF